MLNEALLMSGNDIPFESAGLIIHVPTMKELSLIGEETFYSGCEAWLFNKDNLSETDKTTLEDQSNFNIFIAMMRDKSHATASRRMGAKAILALMFPNYQVRMQSGAVVLSKDLREYQITEKNFSEFQTYFAKIFCLEKSNAKKYNPSDAYAEYLAKKFQARDKKLQELRNESGEQKIDGIWARQISVLSIGIPMGIEQLLNCTLYQLFDLYKRYELKWAYDIHLKAQLAGAKNLEEVEYWMKDIHSGKQEN